MLLSDKVIFTLSQRLLLAKLLLLHILPLDVAHFHFAIQQNHRRCEDDDQVNE